MTILHKTCTQCKVSKPLDEFPPHNRSSDGKQTKCRACRAANQREYARRHPDRKRESDRRYRSQHTEQVTEKKRDWSDRNREKLNQQSAEWRMANREKRNAIVRDYRARHPESYRLTAERCRARKSAADGSCTKAEWVSILKRYAPDSRCPACGKVGALTMDHIVPLSLGGSNAPDNLQPLCNRCNAKKGQRIIDYRT